MEPTDGVAPAITITAAHVAQVRRDELEHNGRAPSAAELAALVEAVIIDEILYREALARRLDVNDAVVERRLVQNMRFVSDEPDSDAPTLLRRAQAAGLQRGDPVIRRRLVQKMRMILESDGRTDEPTDAALRSYFTAHAADFATAPIVELTHVFYEGSDTGNAAVAALAVFRRLDVGPNDASGYGDAFFAGMTLPPHSQHGLAKLFGETFAEESMTLPLRTWSGPVLSVYGAHLVWIRERILGQVPPFEIVRGKVRERIVAERAERALRAGIAQLRQQYTVAVEPLDME